MNFSDTTILFCSSMCFLNLSYSSVARRHSKTLQLPFYLSILSPNSFLNCWNPDFPFLSYSICSIMLSSPQKINILIMLPRIYVLIYGPSPVYYPYSVCGYLLLILCGNPPCTEGSVYLSLKLSWSCKSAFYLWKVYLFARWDFFLSMPSPTSYTGLLHYRMLFAS